MKHAHFTGSKQFGRISLLMTALLMTAVALIGMSFLYYLRFSQWPMQASLTRWSQSLGIIGKEVKKGVGLESNGDSAATIGDGIRKCKINGKVVYSDIDCLESNATTRAVQLQDNRSFSLPPSADKDAASTASSGQTMQEKMMDRAIDKSTK